MNTPRPESHPPTTRAWLEQWVLQLIRQPPESAWVRAAIVVLSLFCLGLIDIATGTRVSLLVFYLIPIALTVAWLGLMAALATSVLAIFFHLGGDFLLGAQYLHRPTVYWNSLVVFSTFVFVAWIIHLLIKLQGELEARVKIRTDALAAEVKNRESLQNELIEISERERRAIGNDLHDGLGQHLTALAYAAKVLSGQLARNEAQAAATAQEVVRLAEDGIQQSRQLARGLLLTAVEPSRLGGELQELVLAVERQTDIRCQYENNTVPLLIDATASSHLFRIAQEAVRNAVRHARPKALSLSLLRETEGLVLRVSDDGCGLPATPGRESGVGLKVMAHRAKVIGAAFALDSKPGQGTRVTCRIPLPVPNQMQLAT